MAQCRRCGCTDEAGCLVAGVVCTWVQDNLCSACATLAELLSHEDGIAWLHLVLASCTESERRPAGVRVCCSDLYSVA